MTDVMLTDKQVVKLAGAKNTKLLIYPEITKYKTLEQLFGKKKNVVILYVHDESPTNIVGHWCVLIKHPKYIEFFDSYGLKPDELLYSFKDANERRRTKQEQNYLSQLLYYYKKTPIEYNEYQYQEEKENINTCGRHCGLRCRFGAIPLTEYQAIFNVLKQSGINIDSLVVELSNLFL